MATLPRLIGRDIAVRQHGNPNLLPPDSLTASGITSRDLQALTAAGFRITHDDTDQLRRLIQPWQTRAFSYYDQLGEIKYAAQFYSRMLSPLRLFAAELDENGDWVETENEEVKATLDRVQDPGGGYESLLGSYGRLMFLVGECYLLCTLDQDTGMEQWEMLSTDELRIQSGIYVRYKAPSLVAEQLHEPDDEDFEPLQADEDDDSAIAYRLWRRHPRYSMLADSTMMGVLDLCEELLLLTRAVRARARSRLAGSGILAISEDFSYAPLEATGDENVQVDPFLADLTAAMMLPIANEGTASAVVPLLVRGPTDAIEKGIRHIPIVDPTQLYPETGLRTECIDRIAIGLDLPPEILKGLEDANHWCTDAETEILTADGWKHHENLSEDDTVLTLNHETGLSEWQPVECVARFEVEDLPMLSIESRFHSSLTTLNHRWPVLGLKGRDACWEREWTHSDELRTTHRLVGAAPSRDSLTPQWVKHEDALVELVAWLWTEGSVRIRQGRRTPSVRIYQSHTANPDNVLRIRAALTSLYGAAVHAGMPSDRRSREWSPPMWREIRTGDKTVFSINRAAAAPLLDHVDADRIVSTDFIRTLTASQLALFIETSVRADGSRMASGTGTAVVSQSDPRRLFPLELAVILLGKSPSSSTRVTDGFTTHTQHCVSISDRQTTRIKRAHLSEKRYTGIVWCPVTGNSTWMARRNGKVYFTGNTAWAIDEQTWKAHGMPIANQLVNDLTAAFFRPTLKDMGIEDWTRYSIQYDPSGVINHPDRTKDARDAFDRRIISKMAYRRIANFNEDDEMPEDERAESVGIATRDSSLAWFGTPAPRGGNVETAPGVVENAETSNGQGGAATGAEVEKGPPTVGETPATTEDSVLGSGNGKVSDQTLARIIGASDLALFRAREAAGARIRTLARRDAEISKLIDGVPARDVAATLGSARVKGLGTSETELVKAATALIRDALRLWVKDSAAAALIADQVEKHAARTLYETKPVALPPQFASYVSGVVSAER